MDHLEIPMNFFHCVGDSQAWRIIISHTIVCILYLYISIARFCPAALNSKTTRSKIVWWSIAIIFPFCACGGYLTTNLAGWIPSIAYPLKELCSHIDILACCVFLWATDKNQLKAVGASDKEDIKKQISTLKASEILSEVKNKI